MAHGTSRRASTPHFYTVFYMIPSFSNISIGVMIDDIIIYIQDQRQHQQHQNTHQHLITRRQPTALFRVATQTTTTNETVEEHSCGGARDVVYNHCTALKWTKEGARSTICCANGQNLNLNTSFLHNFLLCYMICSHGTPLLDNSARIFINTTVLFRWHHQEWSILKVYQ